MVWAWWALVRALKAKKRADEGDDKRADEDEETR
jgi:hypothetical protein